MTRAVWIDGAKVTLAPSALLGQGGEAEVYDLGDGRVVKWWKPADHPDFEGMAAAQAEAAKRISEAPRKLRALPGRLPPSVVAPSGFALANKGGPCAGYVMPKVIGTALHAFGEPRWRRDHPVPGGDVVAALLALYDAIAGLHRAGVVIGDCNDLNVLVDGTRVHLIDVDSYQFGGFACSMFSERFVDPRLCDAQQLVPVRPHDVDSDWFAFAVMAFRSLLGVGPWGGVYQPPAGAPACAATARALRRVSVMRPHVLYPRAARPVAILPDELAHAFEQIFERDMRGVFPRALLERVAMRPCPTCGEEHARHRCPACQTQVHVPAAIIIGNLSWHVLPVRPESTTREVRAAAPTGTGIRDVALADASMRTMPEVQTTTPSGTQSAELGDASMRATPKVSAASGTGVWLAGDALMRMTLLGPERIGSVLAGQTRAWAGAKLGVGFYRAGGYAVGFVFRPDRGVLDDRVALPKLRGRIVDAFATIADDRAWLWLVSTEATTCVVIGADARVIATGTFRTDDDGAVAASGAPRCSWLAGIAGACATGAQLFVPTDAGIARIEVVQGAIVHTRVFAETAPFVSTGDQLVLHPGGIDVVRKRDAIRLQLT